jgi:hypothetical protein
MQAISSIRLLVRSGQARRVLVVCPKGLVSNWTRELADWAPEILVAVIEGDQQRRRWQWSLADVPVKVANYEALVRDRELITELGLSFDLMVLDEAQRIKNRSSQTSEAVRSVPRRRSWALTGTPVENSSDDLVGVFEFIAPGHLNERMSPKVMGAAAADPVARNRSAPAASRMITVGKACTPNCRQVSACRSASTAMQTKRRESLTTRGSATAACTSSPLQRHQVARKTTSIGSPDSAARRAPAS